MRQQPFVFLIVSLFISLLGTGKADAAPALWQISDEDTSIHIFGTLHLVESGVSWENVAISKAFLESDALVVEMDPNQMALAGQAFSEAGRLSMDDHLRHHVGAGIYNDVVRLSRQYEIPAGTFDQTRPWFAGMSLTVVSLVKLGLNPESGVDRTLMNRATAMEKPILGLESAAQQAAVFASLSPAQEKALLVDALRQSVNTAEHFANLQAAWLSGDVAALDTHLNAPIAAIDGLAERLLYARNRTWAGNMQLLLKEPGRFFVAVGAAHLVGGSSLIAELEAANLAPARVQ